MALEPAKIPQNVYVEDRIIGPITLRHLVILGVGAGISYGCWTVVNSSGPANIVIQVMSWIPLVIAAAFAFVRINDISLLKLILLFIEESNKPNVRYWAPHTGLSVNIVTKPTGKELPDERNGKSQQSSSRLIALTQKLEDERREIADDEARELIDKQMIESQATPQETPPPVRRGRIRADNQSGAHTLDGISTGSIPR